MPGVRSRSSEPPFPPRSRWAWHYRTLVALRERLVRVQSDQVCQSWQGEAVPASGSDATDSAHEFLLALLATEPNPLMEINDAIDRILRGSYGVCAVTGLPIPAERLRAVPWACCVGEMLVGKERH